MRNPGHIKTYTISEEKDRQSDRKMNKGWHYKENLSDYLRKHLLSYQYAMKYKLKPQ